MSAEMDVSNENDNEIPKDVIINLQEASMEIKQVHVNNHQRKHVLVIGAVGAGKTSLINMLAGKSTVPVTNTALCDTVDIVRIPIKYQDVEYEFIDTPGLDGVSNLEGMSNEAIAKLFLFLVSEKQNFKCVLFVWRKGRIDTTFSQSASVFKDQLMKHRIPFILVVTGCEMDDNLERTQVSLHHAFRSYCFDDIVCGTTLQGGPLEEYFSKIHEKMKTQLWHCIVESCQKTFNDTPEKQFAILWFIKSMVELFAKGISYGATKTLGGVSYGATKTLEGVSYGATKTLKGISYGATILYDLGEYIIVGRDGQVVPRTNIDGHTSVAQDGKENSE